MASTLGPVADFAYRAKIDATGSVALKVTKPFEVSEVVIRATFTGGTSITIQRSTDGGTTYNDVTNAIAVATDGVVTRAGTIANSQATFAAGDYIKATVAGGAQGIATIFVNPLAITGQ